MSSTIAITKTCEYCRKSFTAKTVRTRYCSHACNSKGYNAIHRKGKVENVKRIIRSVPKGKLQSTFDYSSIIHKEVLTIREASAFLNITDVTLRRWLKTGVIQSSRLGKKHLIQRKHLYHLLSE